MSKQNKKILGITGTIGSGKSTIGKLLENHGCKNIEVDQVGHRFLTDPRIVSQLVTTFGEEIKGSNGEIDRQKLGKIVFSSAESLRKLDSIMHPPMKLETERIIAEEMKKDIRGIVVNAALLFRMKLDSLCDKIVYVTAGSDVRTDRLVKNRGISKESAEIRISAQDPDPGNSEKVIYYNNNGSVEELSRWVESDLLPFFQT
ncbi:MAG: dephospho-CoA kinase [Candidatus Riflebacteria bacterium]|nr:dephospho-CoA kinase [Candidatus Riflebacteria bacterium]